MRAALVALLALACGPKAPPAPAAAGAPPLPPPTVLTPAAAPAWEAGWPAPPPLPGLEEGQELGAVLASRSVFTVEADVSALGAVDEAVAPRLLDTLTADPRWKVTRWRGRTVAFQRARQGDGWAVGWGGYSPEGEGLWRVALWFDAPEWPPSVTPNAPESPAVRVPAWPAPAPYDGLTGAVLLVAGPAVALEVHELAVDLQLDRTARALTRVPLRLATVAQGLPDRHPVAPPGDGPAALWVESSGPDGADVRALLPAAAPAWCWLRVLDGGDAVEEALVLAASLERVGGAAAPGARFELQAGLPLALPPAATLELWCEGPEGAALQATGPAGG